MQVLNLPETPLKTRQNPQGKTEVFDAIRKKYVALQPEEWVRQQFIGFLIHHKNYPASLIAIEKGLAINGLQKRFDAVVFNRNGRPVVLIEFKAPQVKLDDTTFRQVAAYNLNMRVNYLIISNGLMHYCCEMDYEKNSFRFLKDIPGYGGLS
ncbi:MAG: type I restriction enzyme HsdR N-terminal domain-containing protein [Bacteroidales bacterium]|nr:type I restriction enzyme HsdR N-terminal domain-containing protein [Bacteroidales bacterium]MCF6342938.1 type I restriction enzyme HsdR N-terminal domain-containing protein [Bacteroidales bacterium]